MPERAAIIALLIVDRPLCLSCISMYAGLPSGDVHEYLERLRGRLAVVDEESDRCRACGVTSRVFALERLTI